MRNIGRLVIALTLLAAAPGCFFRPATQTARPQVDTAPWTERTARSTPTGHEYRYLHLPGPTDDALPILLLHGGIFDNRMWLRAQELSSRFEVLAFEMPSAHPLYEGSIENFGDVVADFLAALEIEELYVAGVSAGSWAAIDLISRHDDLQVRGLFLISTVMFAINEDEIEERRTLTDRALGFAPERLRSFIQWRVSRTDFPEVEGVVQQRDIFYVRPYSYYSQLFRAARGQGDQPQATTRITCPVLVLHGTADETMPSDVAELTPTVFPDATFVSINGAGHTLAFTDAPRLSRAMLDFVTTRNLPTTAN